MHTWNLRDPNFHPFFSEYFNLLFNRSFKSNGTYIFILSSIVKTRVLGAREIMLTWISFTIITTFSHTWDSKIQHISDCRLVLQWCKISHFDKALLLVLCPSPPKILLRNICCFQSKPNSTYRR